MGGRPESGFAQEGTGAEAAAGSRHGHDSRQLSHWLRSLALLVSLALCASGAAQEASPLDTYPGRMIAVGTHYLHLHCIGSGTPTVVLESGIGGFSLEWSDVQSRLAQHARVCAYDRAGYGWSDAGPLPRTARRSAEELHAALHRAGETAPYLLVGHSYGGFVVRLFADRYRDEVQGLVLVDASSPDQFARLPAGALPPPARPGHPAALTVSMPRLARNFPTAHATTALQLMLLPKARQALASELQHFAASARQIERLPVPVLEVPLIVISRARSMFGTAAGGAASEALWRDMQHRMTALSTLSDHWIAAGAGHQVHMDRPDLVALAVAQASTNLLLARTDEVPRLIVGEFPVQLAALTAPSLELAIPGSALP